jgi:hypothetical protein
VHPPAYTMSVRESRCCCFYSTKFASKNTLLTPAHLRLALDVSLNADLAFACFLRTAIPSRFATTPHHSSILPLVQRKSAWHAAHMTELSRFTMLARGNTVDIASRY